MQGCQTENNCWVAKHKSGIQSTRFTKKTDKILGRSYGQLVQIQIMLNESVPLLILFSVEEEQNFKFDKNLIRRKIEILNWTRHRRDALASRFCVIKIRSEDNKIVCG